MHESPPTSTGPRWAMVARDQLASVARSTPFAMLGYAFNTTLSVFAFHDVIPRAELIAWASYAYGISGFVAWRVMRKRPLPRQTSRPELRSAIPALVFAVLLA